MKIKAKRIKRADSDLCDYEVTCPSGAVLFCENDGKSMFSCAELGMKNARMKVIKAAAEWYSGDDEPATESPPEVESLSSAERGTTFECMDPCAIIVRHLLIAGEPIHVTVIHTLDAYGWLTEKRQPDFARAEQEWEKYSERERVRCAAMKDTGGAV